MTFRQTKKEYGGHHSWRAWRDANATHLADAGVPSVALETQWNWGFFLQEADPTLMGGPPFELDSLTDDQLVALHSLIRVVPDSGGGDLIDAVERAVAHRHGGDG